MRSIAVKKGAEHPQAKYFLHEMTILYLRTTKDCYQSHMFCRDGHLQSSRPLTPFVYDLTVNQQHVLLITSKVTVSKSSPPQPLSCFLQHKISIMSWLQSLILTQQRYLWFCLCFGVTSICSCCGPVTSVRILPQTCRWTFLNSCTQRPPRSQYGAFVPACVDYFYLLTFPSTLQNLLRSYF